MSKCKIVRNNALGAVTMVWRHCPAVDYLVSDITDSGVLRFLATRGLSEVLKDAHASRSPADSPAAVDAKFAALVSGQNYIGRPASDDALSFERVATAVGAIWGDNGERGFRQQFNPKRRNGKRGWHTFAMSSERIRDHLGIRDEADTLFGDPLDD